MTCMTHSRHRFEFGPLTVERYVLGPLDVNTYLLTCGQDGLLIDPADIDRTLQKQLGQFERGRLRILVTHGHADHIAAVDHYRDTFAAPVLVHADDAAMLPDADLNLSAALGLPFEVRPADQLLRHDDTLSLDTEEARVISIPGHTPGGMALVFSSCIIVGDTLFAGSIGRSDLPGGDGRVLVAMLKDRLLRLADRPVFPGHGPETTLAEEKRSNPWVGSIPA
jgi:hydroxyacylglutathione hydrolase